MSRDSWCTNVTRRGYDARSMLAIVGESDAPDPVAAERVRRRICRRVPFLCDRITRLMRLAELGAQGPDPEVALAQLEAADRSLAAFLKITRSI